MGPIVVGVDGSAGSEDAVSFAMRSAPQHGYQVVAVHAGEADGLSGGLQALSPALAAGRELNPAVEVREVIEAGNAAELIVAQARTPPWLSSAVGATGASPGCCWAR